MIIINFRKSLFLSRLKLELSSGLGLKHRLRLSLGLGLNYELRFFTVVYD